jgi:hypothetical protein
MEKEMQMKQFLSGILLLLAGYCAAAVSQTATPAEPEYVNQFFALGADGQLTPLERQPMHHSIKRKNIPMIKVDIESRQDVAGGPASPVHVGSSPNFIVKMMTGNVDPTTLMHLVQLKVDKQGRYYVTGDQQGFVYTNGKSTGPQGDAAPLKVAKYGQNSLDVQPAQPLPAGQYALIISPSMADCFSVDPSLADSAPAAGSMNQSATAKAEPPVWKMKPFQHPQTITDVYEATLAGLAEAGGRRGAAQIDISCTVNRFTGSAGTEASTNAVLKVRREMVAFPTDALSCEGDGATGSPILRTQLGTGQEQKRNLCFDGEPTADPKAVLSFGLTYEEPLISSLFQASGAPLVLKIRPQDGGPDALTTNFQLPANGAEVLAVFDSCLKIEEAQLKKKADAVVVACPEIPNRKLAAVDVLTGSAMNRLAKDKDNDIGEAWNLPKATKARPIVPKLTLACSYQDETVSTGGTASSAKSAAAQKKLMPIPATAKSCVFRDDSFTNIPYGNCSRE